MRTLLGTISDKASNTFNKEITKENYNEYFDHWILTGMNWALELEQEGLTKTCQAVRDHVTWHLENRLIK